MADGIIYFDKAEDLFSFESGDGWDDKDGSEVLQNFNTGREKRPKTLLCHDMKGGYLPYDRLSGALIDEYPPFVFLHWWHIDLFVYFSHHFVTVPPLVWIRQAHRHGVRILGTLITEFDDGKRMCAEILKNRDSAERLSIKLVELCRVYTFDGWLLNIENELEIDHIDNLVHFIRTLRSGLKAEVGDHAQVIWYDSVTVERKLDWQNELNEKNRLWFSLSDGIFLNYTWTIDHLDRTVANVPTDRLDDVFVGIDVFGRGCMGNHRWGKISRIRRAMRLIGGGGGWNCDKPLELIRERNLSAAIFAPGWICEKFPEQCAIENSHRFWAQLLLHMKPRRLIQQEFSTNFSVGMIKENHFYMADAQLQPLHISQEEVKNIDKEHTLFLCRIPIITPSIIRLHCVSDVPLIVHLHLSDERIVEVGVGDEIESQVEVGGVLSDVDLHIDKITVKGINAIKLISKFKFSIVKPDRQTFHYMI